MTIQIEIDGTVYEDFTDVSVSVSMEKISGEFNFTAVTPAESVIDGQFPFKLGQSCIVLVDNVIRILGFIEVIAPSYDNKTHTVSIMGRDRTCDIIDATLGGKLTFDKDITLEDVTRTVLKSAGISVAKTAGVTGIRVINDAGVIDNFKEGEIETGEFGDSIFNFLETICRKKQVLLTTDGLGNVVFARSRDRRLNVHINNRVGGVDTRTGAIDNNILSASGSFNASERFNKYVAQSQENPSAQAFSFNKNSIAGTKGEAFDLGIRPSRTYHFFTESSSSEDECLKRAEWEANIRQVRSFEYSVVLQGHTPFPGITLRTNRIINVHDDFSDIATSLLIKAITWGFSVSEGSTTTLQFAPQDAYQVIVAEPTKSVDEDKGLAGLF